MFVKKLEIQGFKSFADKTTLELTPGTTVVVGPNGCGKSNIADAVRWVLGEQSARYLRGTRMDDIIFSGTSNRKPLSFAEVSLTFDNSEGALGLEYQEVTITRRIYRNGESDYLLNRRHCRLKDILELFMDTGIGKEAYSFIGQGRVDEILNARPEERRQIFEEAAGILKYKSRKREAERRLAETAENLLRVGDIIHELSAQLAPLAEQAETAGRYLDLRHELKGLEVNVLVHDASVLRDRWYALDERCRLLSDSLIHEQAEITKKEVELSQQQFSLDSEQSAVHEMQKEIQRLTSEIDRLQGRAAVTLEKLKGFERQTGDAAAAIGELDKGHAALREEYTRTKKLLLELAANLDNARKELAAAEISLAALEDSPEARQAASTRLELDQLAPEARRLQSEYDRLTVEAEQEEARIQRLQTEREGRLAEAAALLEEKTRCETEAGRIKQTLLESLQNQERNKEVRRGLADTLAKLAEERGREAGVLAEAQGKMRALSELEESMAGYYQGVKSVLQAKKQSEQAFSGICGTVADLIKVPDQYIAAVEAVLGAALQNLVTDDDSVARQAIEYLKKTRGGRATFLPLNLLQPPPAGKTADLSKISGYIGVASHLVSAPERFARVVDSLLNRVHIVLDMEAAVTVARSLGFRERVATVEGEVIMPGGAMTGGAEKKQGGILSRRKEVEALARRVQLHEQRLTSLSGEEAEVSMKLAAADAELDSLAARRHEIELSLSVQENEYVHLSGRLEAAAAAAELLANEAARLEELNANRGARLTATAEQLRILQDSEEAMRIDLARLQGLLAAKEQEKRNQRDRCTEYRVRLAGLQKQQEHREEELERLEKEMALLLEKKRYKDEEIRSVRTSILEHTDRVAELRETTVSLEKERSILLGSFMDREAALKQQSTSYREETEKMRQAEKELSNLERRQARAEMEREKAQMELQSVLDRLYENWQLKYEEARREAAEITDREAVLSRVAKLREEMTALGSVNLGAVDEHRRIAERVQFLTLQREDLQDGERDLQRIIREIDGRMSEKFLSSFTVINEKFSIVFRELFGGGRAHLRLTEPGNLLDTGIEIIAQPPGKKLQHLSLLSGGEKALTAIALLFAFLRVKPTPFCILDEIDTSLDEANLAKFCAYLHGLSGEIQFILVSHRKKTMEQGDILYGVTMEESGISKLISVRLRSGETAGDEASA